MKKYFYILMLLFIQAAILSCTDEEIYESPSNDGSNSIKITLNIPVDNGKTRGLVYGPDETPIGDESKIDDIHVLAFDKASQKYLGKFQSYLTNGMLAANVNLEEDEFKELTVVVLTNLKALSNGSSIIAQIDALTKGGKTKTEVLQSLKYTFDGIWNLTNRLLPMWGETDITPIKNSVVQGEVYLYRAVSKINVVFNNGEGKKIDGIEVFKLKSVRVYYARTSGLAGSLHAPVTNEESGSDLIITPSIPDDVAYFPRYNEGTENNLLFTENREGGSYAIENKIYVPESDQTNTEEPMCLVVGGYYMGSSQETFYRVDFKQGNKGSAFYDAIRNHIYTFNINNVTRPGTDEPDPALDHVVVGMDVTIKEWTPEWMRGIGGQYTLEVSTGGFVLAGNTLNDGILRGELTVTTTHNEGWTIESQSGSWFTTEQTSTGVIIKANQNDGGERRGSFIVKSGNLQKEITVRQRGKGTANCYIVSDNGKNIEQDLIVTVKGNGEVGLVADNTPLEEKDPYISVDKIGDVQIIWETSDGLITIVQENGKAKLDKESGIIKYKVNLDSENAQIKASNELNSQSYKGGNALIGAFGKNGDGSVNYNDLLWTWHIWVCPDIDNNPKDGFISDDELKAIDQEWVTGYTFMDRNMGALGSQPGLSSLGLLYQWGRKDPFIGAAEVSKTRSGNRMYTRLPLEEKGYYWRNSSGDMTVEASTKAPTTLIKGKITGTDYAYLWGTASGLDGEANAGNKTIYDPCPYGYRVPNVAAIKFKGTASIETSSSDYKNTDSEKQNWYTNNEFWPLKVAGSSSGWTKYEQISGKSSYGFWLRYDKHDTEPDITQYSSSHPNNIQNSSNNNKITWLPLSGVYDGNVNELALIDGQNSLYTNSIMWTNSSITISQSEKRPAALFLHGVQSSSSIDGNHFHKLKESSSSSELYAKPQHAGALRCVRDVKVNMGEENAIKVPDQINLAARVNSTQTGELTSLLDGWEVVDPGATWFVMTPDAGSTGSKQTLTFTATQTNVGANRTATIKIRFNDATGTTKSITVIQEGLNLTDHSVTSPINLTSANNNTTSGRIVAADDTWEIISGQVSWLSISPMSSKSINDGGTYDVTYKTTQANTSKARSTTLTVRFGNGDTRNIVVNQAALKFEVSSSELSFVGYKRVWEYYEYNYYAPDPKSITITCDNQTWTATANDNWLTVSSSRNGDYTRSTSSSETTLYIQPTNNRNGSKRNGTITLTNDATGASITIKISQGTGRN